MPQGSINVNPARNQSTGYAAPLQMDVSGNLLTGNGSSSALNKTGTFVVKATPGRVCKVSVLSGTAAITVNDCATTGAVAAGNEVFIIAATTEGSIYALDWPCLVGIVVQAGANTVSVSFD